jgi:hypothetical protein
MKKSIKIVLIFVFIQAFTYAQKEFGKTFIAGTSLTFIPEIENDPLLSQYNYFEYTWNLNAAVSIGRRIFIGAQVLTIFTNGSRVENNTYFIMGLFGQFNFIPKQKFRFFAELSINTGDYCTCGYLDPFRKENLVYLGWGAGFDLPMKFLSKNLYLDLSLIAYLILNDIEDKDVFTQYILGINYRFGKQVSAQK